jgi:peptidyl-prolyl cis-trans isomerase A (cyclophilin A)
MKHAYVAAFLAAGFSLAAFAQQSSAPASQPAQDLPDGPQPTQAALIQPSGPTVVMDTSMGRITCRFFQKQAPEAVANFIGLANGTKDYVDPVTQKKVHGKPYYDHTTFHRVIPEFMIQGGDPTGTGSGGPGYTFADEANDHRVVRGALAMANAGPDTNGSQFFIVTAEACPWLDGKHTVFGHVTAGMDVVDAISQVETDGRDRPKADVVMESVSVA